MALCGILAFYTGNDADRMDRLFRQSELYREKWERPDYRERTIQRAIDTTASTYRPTHRGSTRGHVERIAHMYDWQHQSETTYQRNRLLAQVADDAKEQVRAHFQTQSTAPLVLALPQA
jgi:primase-polymerase (primpol)-like protein